MISILKPDMVTRHNRVRRRRDAVLDVERLECRINMSRLTLLPSGLPSATVGQNYQAAFTAANGVGHSGYAVASGRLPKGLSLAKSGILHGDPKAAGTYHFVVKVTEAGRRKLSASRAFSLIVGPAAAPWPGAAPPTGPVSEFVVIAPMAATAGAIFLVSVTAQDASGHTATGFDGAVTLTSSDGQSVNLLSPLTFRDGGAVASAELDRADAVALTATSGTIAGTSGDISIAAAAACRFVVSAPGRATAGSGFTVSLTAEDAFGNTATGFGGAVALTSSDGQAVVVLSQPGFTGGVGVWTVALDKVDTVTLAADSAGVHGISGSMTVDASAASRFVVTAPATATAGSGFTVSVVAVNAFGNTATGFGGAVALSSSDGQAVNLLSDLTFRDGGAVASAELDRADALTLTAMSGTIIGTSGSISLGPSASTFVVTAPATTTAGSGFTVSVTALDSFGNTATGFDGSVTLASSDGQPVDLISPLIFRDGTAKATVALDRADTLAPHGRFGDDRRHQR